MKKPQDLNSFTYVFCYRLTNPQSTLVVFPLCSSYLSSLSLQLLYECSGGGFVTFFGLLSSETHHKGFVSMYQAHNLSINSYEILSFILSLLFFLPLITCSLEGPQTTLWPTKKQQHCLLRDLWPTSVFTLSDQREALWNSKNCPKVKLEILSSAEPEIVNGLY